MSHSFRVSKNLMLERLMSRFSLETSSFRITEKLSRRTLLCFTNFLVSKNFMEKRLAGREGEREHQNFPSNFVLSPVSKNFVRGIL